MLEKLELLVEILDSDELDVLSELLLVEMLELVENDELDCELSEESDDSELCDEVLCELLLVLMLIELTDDELRLDADCELVLMELLELELVLCELVDDVLIELELLS